ncbi:MAG: hypothetical protein QF675_07010, partial [SAR324 cluster bacterium]|nr:hypothetical protein [SAR324 cluster bacterium]
GLPVHAAPSLQDRFLTLLAEEPPTDEKPQPRGSLHPPSLYLETKQLQRIFGMFGPERGLQNRTLETTPEKYGAETGETKPQGFRSTSRLHVPACPFGRGSLP